VASIAPFWKKLFGSTAPKAAAVLAAAFLAGCGSTAVSTVRIINLSPGTGAIDSFVSNYQAASNLGYSSATSYVQVSSGNHTVSISPSGQDATILTKQVIDFYSLNNLTIFAVNPKASVAELVFYDNNSEPNPDDFKLRIVHTSPSSGVVDVYVTAPSTPITNVPATLRNVSYQAASEYLQFAAGSYDVRFTTAGTKTVLADTAAFTPQIGDIYTVVIADAPAGGPPYQAYTYVDAQFSNNSKN
jgi:Domain of unknown function (DUF4397)